MNRNRLTKNEQNQDRHRFIADKKLLGKDEVGGSNPPSSSKRKPVDWLYKPVCGLSLFFDKTLKFASKSCEKLHKLTNKLTNLCLFLQFIFQVFGVEFRCVLIHSCRVFGVPNNFFQGFRGNPALDSRSDKGVPCPMRS